MNLAPVRRLTCAQRTIGTKLLGGTHLQNLKLFTKYGSHTALPTFTDTVIPLTTVTGTGPFSILRQHLWK